MDEGVLVFSKQFKTWRLLKPFSEVKARSCCLDFKSFWRIKRIRFAKNGQSSNG